MKRLDWRLPVKLVCILLCGILAGFLLMLAVYSLPVEPMVKNVQASVPALDGRWAKEIGYEQLLPGYQSMQLDNTTDAAMLLHAVHESDQPLVTRVVECARYNGQEPVYDLFLRYGQEGGKGMESASIARYWHGYLVLLKPLLLLFSYIDIRMLLTLVQGAMLVAVIAGLGRRGLWKLIPCFALAMVFITPVAAGFSMQFSTMFCTFLAAMLALLYLPSKRFEGHGLPVFFLLTGMITSFVDYLTYPIASFGMPMVLSMFLFPAGSAREEWKRLVLCGISWALGYLGMWAGKWVLAGMFGGEKWFWANLMAKIEERSSDVSDDMILGYGDVLRAVLSVFVKRAYLLAAIAVVGMWLIALVRGVRRKWPAQNRQTSWSLALLGIAALPFVWFFVTKNHTYNHAFFTSRSLCVTAFALSAWLATFVRSPGDDASWLAFEKT